MKLVHEASERDIRMQRVKYALARMTAQLMRLAAGAGSMYRFEQELHALLNALRDIPPGSAPLQDHEAHEALQFAAWGAQYDDIDDARNEIITQALRLAASRIEGNRLQEGRSNAELTHALARLERARDDRRKQFLEQRRSTGRQRPQFLIEPLGLSPRMEEALEFIAEPDEDQRRRMKPPLTGSLDALKRRGLVERGEGPAGLVLTKKGHKARERVKAQRGRRLRNWAP